MMLLSSLSISTRTILPLSSNTTNITSFKFNHRLLHFHLSSCRGCYTTSSLFPKTQTNASSPQFQPTSSPVPAATAIATATPTAASRLHRATGDANSDPDDLVSSAAAVTAAIRMVSTSQVEITQRVEKDGTTGIILPSPDFQRLCVQQLDLFRAIVNPDAVLSVYVRPAGSYVMDRLELRRVTFYSGINVSQTSDIVILIGNFGMPTGLRAAEAALSNQQVQVLPECRAVVFPMVKHPFVLGFLVAEFPLLESETCVETQIDGQSIPFCPSLDKSDGIPMSSDRRMQGIQAFKEDIMKKYYQFTVEQRSRAIKISHSLAMAYVMDQKAMLLQQSSWQNSVRMSNLVEQIRSPLSSIRTLSKMLSVHMKRSEISYDIIEDILLQGDRIKDALQQLQDAVYLTKVNIVRYNEETLKKMNGSTYDHPRSVDSQLLDKIPTDTPDNSGRQMDSILSLDSGTKDLQIPVPPLTLAALQKLNIRPCNVSDVLADLVGAAGPLARNQQRSIKLQELSQPSQVAVEESALRQALSNLIEGALLRTHVGGKVEIISTGVPALGALVVIDDDGPDMHFMTQMHSLTPFGADLISDGMIEDNMTWNFIAGLTVAREMLESYGCVVRVISPRLPDTALGAGGTRIELWMPSVSSNSTDHDMEGEQNR